MSTTTQTSSPEPTANITDDAPTGPEYAPYTVPLTDRMERALYDAMLVVGYVDRARGAPGLYEVFTTTEPYLVDLHLGVCECPDFMYRDGPCKHVHRARFATGDRPIPANADRDRIDPKLGACIEHDHEHGHEH